MLGDNSPVSHVLSGLVSRNTIALCSGLSFQGYQPGKDPWKVEIGSPFGLMSRFAKQPNIKDSGSMHLEFLCCEAKSSMCSVQWTPLFYICRLVEQKERVQPEHSCSSGAVCNRILVSLPRSSTSSTSICS